jgi:PKD repeat protein
MVANNVPAYPSSEYQSCYVAQAIDLTGVSTLTFSTIQYASTYTYGNAFYVQIDSGAEGGTTIASYSPWTLGTSWTSQSIDVSGYTGIHTIYFRLRVAGSESVTMGLDSVSAYDIREPPTLSSISGSQTVIQPGTSITYTASYTEGYPAETYFYWSWGDGSSSQTTSSATTTHIYTQPGIYTPTCSAYNSYGWSTTRSTTTTVIENDFTASPLSGAPPLQVTFYPSVSGATSLEWTFGDGGTSTLSEPIHTYTSAGNYNVTLKAIASNGQYISVTKNNLIICGDQYVIWNASEYIVGDMAGISYSILNPNFITNTYTLSIYAADSLYQPIGDPVLTPQTITNTTGIYSFNTSALPAAGIYVARLTTGSTLLASGTATIISTATLTATIALSGVTYTNSTTVTVLQDGAIIASDTTTTGQVQFNLPTGTYTLTATTMAYAQQTTTVTLTTDLTITMDFILGSSETTTGGSGIAYASTFITFRIQDSVTGMPLTGAQVTVVGKQATNPIEWMSQLFGAAWGENIIDTKLSGITDDYGVVTFAMFQNVLYEINVTYGEFTETRSVQSSALSAEYLIKLDITTLGPEPAANTIETTVTSNDGTITATYNDTTRTTTSIVMNLSIQNGTNFTLIDSKTAISQTANMTFNPSDYSGQSYKVSIISKTTTYGTITREYGVSFPGPTISIGIPDSLYIWVILFILVILGAIGTVVTSPMYAFVIVFIAWAMWWFGWMFSLGIVAIPALTIATVVAIIYYLVKKQEGVS